MFKKNQATGYTNLGWYSQKVSNSVSDSNSNIIPIIYGLNPKFEIKLKLKLIFEFKLKHNTYSQVSIYLNSGPKSYILAMFMDYSGLPLMSLKFLRLWLY